MLLRRLASQRVSWASADHQQGAYTFLIAYLLAETCIERSC